MLGFKGSLQNKFSVKVGNLAQGGGRGGGLTQSQLFSKSTKTQFALELPINVGNLSQYGGGSPVPTKKSPKMPSKITKNHVKITKKMGLFHEKNNMLRIA